MLANWLSGLFARKASPSSRQARSMLLSVEVLEGRELLSASMASRFVLRKGNLYQQTGTTRRLVDRGVVQYAIGLGKASVYCLETDGELRQFATRGPRGSTLIDSDVQSFTLAADGVTLTEQKHDGSTWQVLSGVSRTQLSGSSTTTAPQSQEPVVPQIGVVKSATRLNGVVYTLTRDGFLHDSSGAGWANTRDFALAPDGTLYCLGTAAAGGWLQKQAPGSSAWENVAPNTIKFALAPDGTCYSLSESNSWLYVNGGGGWGNTQDFALAQDGTLCWLGTTGLLQRSVGDGWEDVFPGVALVKFQIAPDGRCYGLDSSNFLHDSTGGGWANTLDLAVANDGTLYWLGTAATGGLLEKQLPGGTGEWVHIDSNVAAFSLNSDGTLSIAHRAPVSPLPYWAANVPQPYPQASSNPGYKFHGEAEISYMGSTHYVAPVPTLSRVVVDWDLSGVSTAAAAESVGRSAFDSYLRQMVGHAPLGGAIVSGSITTSVNYVPPASGGGGGTAALSQTQIDQRQAQLLAQLRNLTVGEPVLNFAVPYISNGQILRGFQIRVETGLAYATAFMNRLVQNQANLFGGPLSYRVYIYNAVTDSQGHEGMIVSSSLPGSVPTPLTSNVVTGVAIETYIFPAGQQPPSNVQFYF